MTADVEQIGAPSGEPQTSEPEAHAVKRGAFSNVSVSDYVTDALAVVLLLASLSLPWAVKDGEIVNAGDVAWVLPVTLLSVLTLTLPYLARFGVLPSSWTVHTTRKTRLLANLPYAAAVLVHLVLDGAGLGGFQGIGTAAALGLAGAALAATPRRSELGPVQTDRNAPALWWKISIGLIAAMGALVLAWIALFTVEFFSQSSISGSAVKTFILVLVEVLAVTFLCIASALLTVLRRSVAWRNVAITLGVVATTMFYIGDANQVALETLQSGSGAFALSGAGLVLVPALAAILAAPAVARVLNQQHEVTHWLTTANSALRYVAITSGVLIVVAAIALIDGLELASGITAIVLLLIVLVFALVADKALLRNVNEGRRLALLAAGVTLFLGVSLLITAPVGSRLAWLGSAETLTWTYVLLAVGLPILIGIALLGPAPVRRFFATNAPAPRERNTAAFEWQEPVAPAVAPAQQYGQASAGMQQQEPTQAPVQAGHTPYGQAAPASPVQSALPGSPAEQGQHAAPNQNQAPVQSDAQVHNDAGPSSDADAADAPAASGVETAHPQTGAVTDRLDVRDINSGFTSQVASDPATPAATLAQIVEEAPHLRPEVAANPTTYPALLEWLGELGDPAVDEALRTRQQ